jgi:2-dehydro-3-deoxy-D-arabinonate dehydratase
MKLAKIQDASGTQHVAVVEESGVRPLDLSRSTNCDSLMDILNSSDPTALANSLLQAETDLIANEQIQFLAPIDAQEVWAAGVTYKRSQVARMDESESAASHYDQVYTADRPELFLKATPRRVSGPGQPVRVRTDSQWSVPEPELALVVNPDLQLVGFTIGNDMSARDIEGENPLYLPQAKVYNQCCGLGPCVLLADEPLERSSTQITLSISRAEQEVFRGTTDIGQMARTFDDLIGWLGKENTLPDGAFLLTGTGIVPPDEFSLADGDRVTIEITGIGQLTNPVVQSSTGG